MKLSVILRMIAFNVFVELQVRHILYQANIIKMNKCFYGRHGTHNIGHADSGI